MLLADTNIWLAAADRRSDRHQECAAIDLTAEDWQRCAELAEQYASLRLDLIDASLVAVAERLGHTRLATLNHRDFTVVRPRHASAFTLLPG